MQFLPPPIWMMFWKSSKRPFVHNVQWHSTQCSRQQALSQQLLQSSATPNDIFTFYSVFMAGKRKCPGQSSCISFFSFFILYFPFSSPSSPFYGWKCQGRRSNCRRLHSLTEESKWDNPPFLGADTPIKHGSWSLSSSQQRWWWWQQWWWQRFSSQLQNSSQIKSTVNKVSSFKLIMIGVMILIQ